MYLIRDTEFRWLAEQVHCRSEDLIYLPGVNELQRLPIELTPREAVIKLLEFFYERKVRPRFSNHDVTMLTRQTVSRGDRLGANEWTTYREESTSWPPNTLAQDWADINPTQSGLDIDRDSKAYSGIAEECGKTSS